MISLSWACSLLTIELRSEPVVSSRKAGVDVVQERYLAVLQDYGTLAGLIFILPDTF